ncbi:MAG: hypothetical protein R3F14_01790 [Polyangiaceae bacterium]
MKTPAFRALIAVAAMMGALASCKCTGSDGASGAASTGEASGTGEASAAAVLTATGWKLQNGMLAELVTGPCGEAGALAVLLPVGIDHDPAERSGMARLAGRVLATMAGAGSGARTVETGGLHAGVGDGGGDALLGEIDGVGAWMGKVQPSEEDLRARRRSCWRRWGSSTGGRGGDRRAARGGGGAADAGERAADGDREGDRGDHAGGASGVLERAHEGGGRGWW